MDDTPEFDPAVRKDYLRGIGAVVYTDHARGDIIPRIEQMPFPDDPHLDLAMLGSWASYSLELTSGQRVQFAEHYGIAEVAEQSQVTGLGFEDRHFTALFAGAIAKDLSRFLLEQGLITDPLSMADAAQLFQTTWFGDLLADMAHSGNGLYQRAASATDLPADRYIFSEAIGFGDEAPYEAVIDEESGLYTVKLTHAARSSRNELIPKDQTDGCPVARTRLHLTGAEIVFLEEHDLIGETAASGFVADSAPRDSEVVPVWQPSERTAIHDVAHAWGRYVDRYARHLAAHGHEEVAEPTSAAQTILLRPA